MERARSRARAWLVSGVIWALLFGVVHLAWAAGSRFGLADFPAADAAFEQVWFRGYNLGVAVASVVLAVAALTRLRGHQGRTARAVRAVIWLAAVVLLLRGLVRVGQLLWLSLFSVTDPLFAWSVDLYMLLGGVIFLVAALAARPIG
jgi:hypothetical protein